MAMILEDGRHLFRLVRLAPLAFRVLLGHDSPRTATIGPDFPRHVLAMNRRAMLLGPLLYLRERLRRTVG
jgi:hypothetical protein